MAAPGAPSAQRAVQASPWLPRFRASAALLVCTFPSACAAASPAPASAATNWATPALGASAAASSAGYWAGYTAEPRFALDDDPGSYWSSTGGAVCCTESNPAWLLVSLGTLRPVAALQLTYNQDMTFTLALGNASDGPFVTVATQFCELCLMNVLPHGDRMTHRTYAVPGAPIAASFARMQITYSCFGGIGGCDDLCDWATDVHTFAVFGPGELPEAAALQPVLPPADAAGPMACADVSQLIAASQLQAVLTGSAAVQAAGTGAHGSTAIQLTGAEARQRGAAEYTRIVRPAEECGACRDPHTLHLSLHVWMGGSRGLPGEGLVVSLVDATRQTPGATRYVQAGCGVRRALPMHALSVVLDTADNDGPGCDGERGTGMQFVSTLDADAPPVVLQATLEMGTQVFRTPQWVPLEFNIARQPFAAGASASWAPSCIVVNGSVLLAGSIDFVGQLGAFYVVASALTSERAADAHRVSSLDLTCSLTALKLVPENWDGFRQPYAPPPMLHPPPPAVTTLLAPAVTPATPHSAVSFVAAFGITTALLAAAAAIVARLRRPQHAEKHAEQLLHLVAVDAGDESPLVFDASAESARPDFDAFLSYRRADFQLADALHDKLRLCGLRVFKDIDGPMAGTPFGPALIRAVGAAPIFAPLVTLQSLQRMAQAGPEVVDSTLAEWLAALHFRASGSVRLIHPLLAPIPAEEAGQQPACAESLAGRDPCYAAALAALPDVVPTATVRAVAAALRATQGAPLSPEEAGMSVRAIVTGVLSGTSFAVCCLPNDLGLYISNRYAPPMLRVAEEARAQRRCKHVEAAVASDAA